MSRGDIPIFPALPEGKLQLWCVMGQLKCQWKVSKFLAQEKREGAQGNQSYGRLVAIQERKEHILWLLSLYTNSRKVCGWPLNHTHVGQTAKSKLRTQLLYNHRWNQVWILTLTKLNSLISCSKKEILAHCVRRELNSDDLQHDLDNV